MEIWVCFSLKAKGSMLNFPVTVMSTTTTKKPYNDKFEKARKYKFKQLRVICL